MGPCYPALRNVTRTEPQPSNLQPIILFNEENRAQEFLSLYFYLYLWAHTGANNLISKSKISEWMTPHSTMTYQSKWVITSQDLPTIYYHTVLFVYVLLLQLLFEWWVWCQGLANTNIVGLQGSWSCNTQDTKLHESKQVYLLHLTLIRTKTRTLWCYGKQVTWDTTQTWEMGKI